MAIKNKAPHFTLHERLSLGLVSKKEARKILSRYQRNFHMRNGNGFRQPSMKNGPARQMSVWDLLAVIAYGSSAIPARQAGRRGRDDIHGRTPAERRKEYLAKVRNNPRYPSGDRRLKMQPVFDMIRGAQAGAV